MTKLIAKLTGSKYLIVISIVVIAVIITALVLIGMDISGAHGHSHD
ncbi:MAG: hypothetical protein V7750_18900 [Sneathiella sp.]